MITISLRFEEEMKKELDDMCDEMGMNLTTFFMIYAKKVLRDRRIPFDIVAPTSYDEDELSEGAESIDSGPPGRRVQSVKQSSRDVTENRKTVRNSRGSGRKT